MAASRSNLRRLVVLVLALELLFAVAGFAASPAENRAFDAAARSFNAGFYERADREWGDFSKQFSESDRLPQAILYQAEARFHLGRFDAVFELLNAHLGKAGKLADQYRYWVAETQFQRGSYPAAADAYAQLARDFPLSPLRLKAAYGEAIAWFNAGDLVKALERLRQPDGAFQLAAQAQPRDEFTVRGYLLLAEALLRQKDSAGTEAALHHLDNLTLSPDLKWKKDYLTIQLLVAGQRLDAAIKNATNLMAWTLSSGLRALQAETVALQGDILQKLDQPEAAITIYTNNLAAGVPPERQRQALMKIIELYLAQDKATQAIGALETFLRERPKDPALDLVRLTLGELQLKAYERIKATNLPAGTAPPGPAATNLLTQAHAQFDGALTNFPQSPLLGKVQLGRGWCLWEEGRFGESEAAFREATTRLPLSEDQAVARFKWADAQFQSGNFGGAITNYQQVLDYAGSVPGLPGTMSEQALYQMVRAGIKSGNATAATNALGRILAQYPDSFFCDDSLLLVGQDLNRRGKPDEARKVFADFLKRYPDSSLVPELYLAVARTYVREGNLADAIAQYDAWVVRFTNYPSWSQAEFDRAWLNYEAGRQSNAVTLLTNYVARFPSSTNAPLAQYLVAGYFFGQGDFLNAELNYKILFQSTNWPPSDLTYQARMMAGRAAFARGGFKEAVSYFVDVINDDHAPPALVVEAYYYYGDTVEEEPPKDPANPLQKHPQAIQIFSKIPATNHLAPRAWGRIADCYLQMAAQDPSQYDRAVEFYGKVMGSDLADLATRSQAEVGLGLALEKQAELKAAPEQPRLVDLALDHYLNVLNGKNLREGEKANPYWLGQAGFASGKLLEKGQKWGLAVKIYQRLMEVPPLRAAAENKLAAAKAHLGEPEK